MPIRFIEVKRFQDHADIRAADYPPGAFCWTETLLQPSGLTHIAICVPMPPDRHPSERMRMLRIYRKGWAKPEGTSWEWDGDLDLPTLSPSIGVSKKPDGTYTFHGWLKAGVLEWD